MTVPPAPAFPSRGSRLGQGRGLGGGPENVPAGCSPGVTGQGRPTLCSSQGDRTGSEAQGWLQILEAAHGLGNPKPLAEGVRFGAAVHRRAFSPRGSRGRRRSQGGSGVPGRQESRPLCAAGSSMQGAF